MAFTFRDTRGAETTATAGVPVLAPATKSGRKRRAPSQFLQSLVFLKPSPHPNQRPIAANFDVREYRRDVAYINLHRYEQRGTVREYVEKVCGLDIYVYSDADMDIDLDLNCEWNRLDDGARIWNLISIRFAISTPRALILDGAVPSIELERRILRLARKNNIPLVWYGCSEQLSRVVEHTKLVTQVPHRRKKQVQSGTTANGNSNGNSKKSTMPPKKVCNGWEYFVRLIAFAGIALSCVDARKLGTFVTYRKLNLIKVPTPEALTFHNGAIDIEWWRISTLLVILLCVIAASTVLSLDISTRLCIAAARCLIQLSVLGMILVPIIDGNSPFVVLGYVCFMILIAGLEASSRPAYIYPRMFLVCFLSIAATVSIIGTFVFSVVIRTGLDARYVIPILGMLMGNSLSGISVGVSSILRDMMEKLDSIEALLALGATKWEAALDAIKNSTILALTPVLNTMSVVGLVVIPGMMTGQIIGGTSPSVAARYQIVIMYSISGGICFSTILSVIGTILCITDHMHRFRTERLVKRNTDTHGNVRKNNFVDGAVEWIWQKIKPRRQPFVALPTQNNNSSNNAQTNGTATRYGSVDERTDR